MQFFGPGKPPVGIVFDSDMGNSIDDVLALAMLHAFDGKNEARLVALGVSKANLKAAAFTDAIRSFYSSATNPQFRGFFRGLPVGLADDGKMPEDTPILTAPLEKRNAEGAPAYEHGIKSLNDTAIVEAVIRNAFTAQHDGNCIVVLSGPATNLMRVLALREAKELIARKVQLLAVVAGAYPDGAADSHVKSDIAAAKKLFAEWPTPIIAVGSEVGEALPYPGSSIEADFSWAPSHPVVDAYRAYKPMPYDAPASALAATLYALRPKEGYFQLSDPGSIAVADDGRTRFTPAADGKHRYLIVDPAQKERVIKTYIELASAKPMPRQFRRPQQQQDQQQQQQQKPPAAPPKPEAETPKPPAALSKPPAALSRP